MSRCNFSPHRRVEGARSRLLVQGRAVENVNKETIGSRQFCRFVLLTLSNLTTRHDAYASYTFRLTDAFLPEGQIEVF